MVVIDQGSESITTSVAPIIRRPSLLISSPSTQLTTYTAHAHPPQISPAHSITACTDSVTKKLYFHPSSQTNNNNKSTEISRTQHKLMLQRQSFLADDKNYLDHPDNMRRLTKELDRVNREYRCVKQYQDPFTLSLKRVIQQQQQQQQQRHAPPSLLISNSTLSSAASSWSSTSSQFMIPPQLQRRASSHTVHDYLMNFKEERRHSLSNWGTDRSSPGFISRIFGSTVMHHPPLSSPQLKRHPRAA